MNNGDLPHVYEYTPGDDTPQAESERLARILERSEKPLDSGAVVLALSGNLALCGPDTQLQRCLEYCGQDHDALLQEECFAVHDALHNHGDDLAHTLIQAQGLVAFHHLGWNSPRCSKAIAALRHDADRWPLDSEAAAILLEYGERWPVIEKHQDLHLAALAHPAGRLPGISLPLRRLTLRLLTTGQEELLRQAIAACKESPVGAMDNDTPPPELMDRLASSMVPVEYMPGTSVQRGLTPDWVFMIETRGPDVVRGARLGFHPLSAIGNGVFEARLGDLSPALRLLLLQQPTVLRFCSHTQLTVL